MCLPESRPGAASGAAHAGCAPVLPLPTPKLSAGSRRRRLWELTSHAYCPLIGVCLPLPVVRRLADKILGGQVLADDYEMHCGLIAECKQRTPLAEAAQRELDQRCATALRAVQRLKTTEALAGWWREALAGDDVAGALWAVLSHPRCDALLEEGVLHDVHMLQHQLGAANRADLQRLRQLQQAHAALTAELAAVQQRAAQQAQSQGQRIEQLQAQLMQQRAELIGRDTALSQLREELAALQRAQPEPRRLAELERHSAWQRERLQALERALAQARETAELADAARRRAEAALQAAAPGDDEDDLVAVPAEPAPPPLQHRAVLCVGGRPASVPVYRRLVEDTGGRFLHHDGGDENSVAQLESTLAAADLVICQTGCVSHDAYWRVKDHCKRTGKRCLFVDKPSRSRLQRALRALQPAAEEVATAGPALAAGLR